MHTRSVRLLPLALSLVAAASVNLVSVTSAGAQGFGLNEIGSCALGRGNAVTGAPCNDASVIYWNPAAATQLKGWSIYGGASAIAVGARFTQDTTGNRYNANPPIGVPPALFAAYRYDEFSLGLGVYVPYGLTSQWRQNFPGRFEAQKAALQTIYIQPNVAFEIFPGWSIGGGPVYGTSTVELRQSADLSTLRVPGQPVTFGQIGVAPLTEFARAKLHGTSSAWGYNVGIFGKINDSWSIGGRYLSKLNFDYAHARATFTQVPTGLTVAGAPGSNPFGVPAGTPYDALLAGQFTSGSLISQDVETSIVHPWQAEVGIGYTGFARTTLSADVARFGYSEFKSLPIQFNGPAFQTNSVLLEDYKDSWSFRVGAEHITMRGIALRAGYSYVQSPAPDITVTALLPDQNRNNYNVGLGLPLLRDRLTLDVGYEYVATSGRRGRIIERSANTPSATETAAQLNGGFYELQANVLSLSLKINY